MFAKLLKHEWKATAGTVSIFSLAVLGAGILGAVILRLLVNYADPILSTDSPLIIVVIALGMMLFFLCLALAAYAAGIQFFLLARFYKNKFTDEGYLTFTLPVSSHKIFLSSLLNIAFWTVISLVVVFAAVCIALLFGTATTGLVNTEVLSLIVELFGGLGILYGTIFGELNIFLIPVQMLVNLFSGILLMMTCITVGSVIAKKHKILASFGIYYGISMIVSIISTVAMFLLMIGGLTELGNEDRVSQYLTLFECLFQLALGIGGYFLSTWLIRRKLNLP